MHLQSVTREPLYHGHQRTHYSFKSYYWVELTRFIGSVIPWIKAAGAISYTIGVTLSAFASIEASFSLY